MGMEVTFLGCSTLYRIALTAYARLPEDDDLRDGLTDAIVAAVFCAATLESMIAEVADAAEVDGANGWSDAQSLATLVKQVEDNRGSVLLKYHVAHMTLTGRAYDRGAKPFQDVALLFDIRNSIAHLKPYTAGLTPHKLVAAVSSRGLCRRQQVAEESSWFGAISTRAMARWACNIVPAVADTISSKLKPNERGILPPFLMGVTSGYLGVNEPAS